MEQPLPKPAPSSSPSIENSGKKKKKFPTPQELISHYESQGLSTQEASLKVIGDLQSALFRVVTTSSSVRGGKNERPPATETSRKLDVLNARLLNLDAKIDSKPGYAATFAIGVTSGAVLRGVGTVLPQVAGAMGQIWNAVRATTTANK